MAVHDNVQILATGLISFATIAAATFFIGLWIHLAAGAHATMKRCIWVPHTPSYLFIFGPFFTHQVVATGLIRPLDFNGHRVAGLAQSN